MISHRRLVGFSVFALAFAARDPVWRRACPPPSPLPSWTLANVTVAYSVDVSPGGVLSFALTNTRTNATDAVNGTLLANSVFERDGTPSDPGLVLQLQTLSSVLYVTINETVACGNGTSSPTYILGVAQFPLHCPEDNTPPMTCTLDSATVQGRLLPDILGG